MAALRAGKGKGRMSYLSVYKERSKKHLWLLCTNLKNDKIKRT